MENQTFSFRSVSLSALLHALLLFLLLYLVQSDPLSLVPPQREEEAAVVFLPQTQPPVATGQMTQAAPPQIASSFDSASDYAKASADRQDERMQDPEIKNETSLNPRMQPPASTLQQTVPRNWSPDHAKQAWRKKAAQEPENSISTNPEQSYQDGLMHKIIEGIPIEKRAVPLRQRVNAQWVKEGQEHFQHGVIKTICYELNKQKIMEASSNLPRKIVLKVILARSGELIDAQLIEKSYSPRFDEACIRAIRAAAPYRRAPATVEGDPVTLLFTLYHDRSQVQGNGNIPTPITFYIN